MKRTDGRRTDELRPFKIHSHYLSQPDGCALIEMGRTRVLCAASVENSVPRWMREQGQAGGWVSAEYSMLPYATAPRKQREITRGRPEGRTQEIQRLVGRALRAVVDLEKLGERTVWVDCDVLQADGGTRTAAINGGYVALVLALRKLQKAGKLSAWPLDTSVAAISVGLVGGRPLLDLCYEEDAAAAVDMNVVMTGAGRFVEVQGSGEEATFSQRELTQLLKLAAGGISTVDKLQQKVLKD